MPTENNWTDITATLNDEPVETWNSLEAALGAVDLEAKGYSNKTTPIRSFVFNEGKDDVNMRFYMFRDDAGALICFCASYIVDGLQKPWLLMTHPDYQRQGYGTRLTDYITNHRAEETAGSFQYAQAWGDVAMTASSAAFANKYANSKLD